jgi:hypothetical protein
MNVPNIQETEFQAKGKSHAKSLGLGNAWNILRAVTGAE